MKINRQEKLAMAQAANSQIHTEQILSSILVVLKEISAKLDRQQIQQPVQQIQPTSIYSFPESMLPKDFNGAIKRVPKPSGDIFGGASTEIAAASQSNLKTVVNEKTKPKN